MKILSASQLINDEWVPIPECQIKADMPKLLKMHEKAKKSNPTWAYFGGILTIEGRKYQVA